ncbi:hypothetical protein ACFWMG_04595 [Streptomyces sp. NPDC127074]|uniref:hypothetical protein n=1 Tax=Streptomyces sp. NPDC127074 TaxID=3347130 RepID=UPI003654F815
MEVELIAWLGSQLDTRFAAELPANLLEVLPLGQVQRVGGNDDSFRLDRALVDLDAYAATRAGASALARETRDALVMRLPGTKTAAAVFGRVSTVSAPSWRPYENTGLRRCGATYEIFFHPVS